MSYEKSVSDHYLHGSLLKAIESALPAIGKTTETVTIEDLAADSLQETLIEAKRRGAKVEATVLDVADPVAVSDYATNVEQQFGHQ
ncbi:MAG: hypothetical protein ACJAYN_003155 [Bermanella sp.]|jgi:hypothetical protein